MPKRLDANQTDTQMLSYRDVEKNVRSSCLEEIDRQLGRPGISASLKSILEEAREIKVKEGYAEKARMNNVSEKREAKRNGYNYVIGVAGLIIALVGLFMNW